VRSLRRGPGSGPLRSGRLRPGALRPGMRHLRAEDLRPASQAGCSSDLPSEGLLRSPGRLRSGRCSGRRPRRSAGPGPQGPGSSGAPGPQGHLRSVGGACPVGLAVELT
jgi:hypothetical protein